MSSAAALLPCQLSAQVLGRDNLRGFAKNRLKPRQVQRHVFWCSGGLSVIRKVGDRLRQGDTTAQEILSMHLEKILVTDQAIGSFVSQQIDAALLEAKQIDKKLSAGLDPGPLAGIPFGIKDNICVSNVPSTAGSRILETHYPPFDSHVVSALKASGAIILGKTNLDEFGMGSTTENSAFRVTRNPWDRRRVPGGSSGGSAAAVAQHQCIAALGSDTGGSIRQPASFCGVVGLKPTFGLLSRHGLMSYASSFDCIGPVTSSVEDAAIVLSVMSKPAQQIDSTVQMALSSLYHEHLPDIERLRTWPLLGRRFAIVKETIGPGVDISVVDRIVTAARDIEKLGGVVDVISCPSFHLGLPAYYILAVSEASSNLARYDNIRFGTADSSRSEDFGDEVKRRILMGSYALSAGHSDSYYKRAQEVFTTEQQHLHSLNMTLYNV
mmetsp:Transcript_9954/g.45049  ORF Transcript_9954/g.45049 Transcript_9954/m.45049 type:complete len:438 (-) Transcript_9954:1120-2433(-)